MKTIFITTGMLLASLSAQAAVKDSLDSRNARASFSRVELGFRLMPTVSHFNMSSNTGGTVTTQATFGFGIGGMLGFNFSRHMGAQVELIYNSLSQKYKDQDLDRQINVRYINIPLLLTLNTDKSKQFNLNGVFGPQIGVNRGSKITKSGSGGMDTFTTVIATKTSDFGVAYGAGLEFMINEKRTMRFDMGFRGVLGLVNIIDPNSESPANTNPILRRANVRTYSAYFGLTFLF